MASQEEIVDALAGMAMFADLSTPQLQGVAHIMDEAWFPAGERILRQGLTGGAFYVILEGEAEIRVDGADAGDPRPRRVLRRDLDPARRIAGGRRRGARSPAGARPRRSRGRDVPQEPPHRHVPDAPGPGPSDSERQPVAEADASRPFPPGDYPVVVVGSGPGALQVSYSLRAPACAHAVISADDGTGWHVPALAVLPAAPVVDQAVRTGRARHATLRALRLEQPARRRAGEPLAPADAHGRHVVVPVATGDGEEPPDVRRRADANRRSATDDSGRRPARRRPVRAGDDGRRIPLPVPDLRGGRRAAVDAVESPGMELVAHYADTRKAETYAGKRIFIIGKQNSGFELATRPAPVGARASSSRRRQPGQAVGEHVLAGRNPGALPPALRGPRDRRRGRHPERRDRDRRAVAGSAFLVTIRRTDTSAELAVEADEVIAATGLHVAAAGPAGAGRRDVRPEPAAGADAVLGERDGARDLLRRDDRPGAVGSQEARHCRPNSGAVHGARYNARVLARYIASDALRDRSCERPMLSPGRRPAVPPRRADPRPEVWHQRVVPGARAHGRPRFGASATRGSCR